jgi:alpha-tubulin suppressor-like RCC1 family protein
VAAPLTEAMCSQTSAGYYHSVVLSTSGEVFAFGRNDYGQVRDKSCTSNAGGIGSEVRSSADSFSPKRRMTMRAVMMIARMEDHT